MILEGICEGPVYLNTDIDLRLFITKKQNLLWESQRPFSRIPLQILNRITQGGENVQEQHENL